jgi:glycosyltransferase involved in cell wall biosynthesis
METFARRLVPALAAARPDVELVAFVNREAARSLAPDVFGPVTLVPVTVSGSSRVSRVLAEQVRLPALARRFRVDLLHSLGTTHPARPGVPSVVTLYDVIYARYPEAHTAAMRLGLRMLVPLAARSADRIIAISEAAAADIVDVLHVQRSRIDVVYPGGLPLGLAVAPAEIRRRYGLGEAPLVLSVSARRPHKNLARLLRAFARVREEPAPLLVLPGYPTDFEGELETEIRALGLNQRVRILPWIPNDELEGLYAAAACFVFPSLIEGFGLPVLEALERGLPVACSNTSSLPEVAGEAARYFDPESVEEIAAAITELLSDQELSDRLRQAGRAQARRFSWERAAAETFACYGCTLAEASPSRSRP